MPKFIIFIGPPGCGKGTQAALLRDKLGYDHVSTGAVLRAEIEAGTPLGRQAKGIIEKGGFIEDSLIEDMLVSYLAEKSDRPGFILDGFPRTLTQGKWFENYLNHSGSQLEKVIYFFVLEEILTKRLSGRFTCAQCGASYNHYYKKPKVDNVCDACGHTSFSKRKDDDIAHVGERIRLYNERTGPLLPFYEKTGFLVKVDAMRRVEDIFTDVSHSLDS